MTTRLETRIGAAEQKIAGGDPDNAVRLYFVEGHPTEGAKELLQANGRDLSRPHAILAFVPAADGKPVPRPLVELTDIFQRDVA